MEENKKDYEIAFLLNSAEAAKTLLGILSGQGAEVVYQSPLKEVALAYPIQKRSSAQFGFYHFKSSPEAIDQIKKALTLNEDVLRSLIITPPVKMAGVSSQQRQERKPATPVMSNEMLEGKLEEMLK